LDALVSEIHLISAIVLSRVSAARACGTLSYFVGFMGTHQQIMTSNLLDD